MIKKISWDLAEKVWKDRLWPDRSSPIQPTSAMSYLQGHDMGNKSYQPTFFGLFDNDNLVAINSGHRCSDGSYRSRGLWVDEYHRRKGYGKQLLLKTIEQAREENCDFCWSYPRKTSWSTYEAAGFVLTSDWQASETSDANAFCYIKLNVNPITTIKEL
jgi:GNAT superfamily N-acetyltransferase